MERKLFNINVLLIVSLTIGIFSFSFAEEKAEADIEYLDFGNGQKLPLYADPCEQGGQPKEAAEKYIKENRFYQVEVDTGNEIIAAINSGNVEDKDQLSKIIEVSLASFACENGYMQKRTRHMGWPYFLKDQETQEGIYVGMQYSYGMHYEGLMQGYAEFELDTRGMTMDTYYLQVFVTKLNPEPNEKSSHVKDEKAAKLLNDVVAYSYKYALSYYTAIAELAAEMEQVNDK